MHDKQNGESFIPLFLIMIIAETLPAVAALCFGLIHGNVGVPEHGFRIQTIIGENGNTDTGADGADMLVSFYRLIECFNGLFRNQFGTLDRGGTFQQDNKLITTKPTDGIRGTKYLG